MRRPPPASGRGEMSASLTSDLNNNYRVLTGAQLLSLGFPAAGGFGFFDRAEPARALADLHLDLRIPAAGRLVIDAFACAVDVALDGAVGRGRDFAARRSEQDGAGVFRRLGCAENRSLLVAHAPVPWRAEGAL